MTATGKFTFDATTATFGRYPPFKRRDRNRVIICSSRKPSSVELSYPHLLMASRWTELAFEFADDSGSTVTLSSAAGGEILRWRAADDDPLGSGGRVAFVGLSAEQEASGGGGGGFVGARFLSEGTADTESNWRGERDP